MEVTPGESIKLFIVISDFSVSRHAIGANRHIYRRHATIPLPVLNERPMSIPLPPARAAWRNRLYQIIFEADTPAGKAFDVGLIVCILVSVALVMLDSVQDIHTRFHQELWVAEWVVTVLFSAEYLARLLSAPRPWAYARSLFGVIDLLSILPTLLMLLFPELAYLLTIRALRLLRIFRIFKLGRYIAETQIILTALRQSRQKITVFLTAVCVLVVVMGSTLYVVEGPANGFTSIPKSMYWAIVTITTVGYGDIAPKTPLGQLVASLAMISGYAIIAVPTGIVSSELIRGERPRAPTRPVTCPHCLLEGHQDDARFCRACGAALLSAAPALSVAHKTQRSGPG